MTELIMFNVEYSKNGQIRYYSLCDGRKRHIIDIRPDPEIPSTGYIEKQCNNNCANGIEVSPEDLDETGQLAIGYFTIVPQQKVWIRITNINSYCVMGDRFETIDSGKNITPAKLRSGRLLSADETVKCTQTRKSPKGGKSYSITYIITNKNGRAIIARGDAAERKEFAKRQKQLLLDFGFNEKDSERIIKAAGPGQIQEALEFAELVLRHLSDDQVYDWYINLGTIDLACALLKGLCVAGYGIDRAYQAIQCLGIEPPKGRTRKTFFGVIAGAREIIFFRNNPNFWIHRWRDAI